MTEPITPPGRTISNSPGHVAAKKAAKAAEARKLPDISPARQSQAIAGAVARKEPRPKWAGSQPKWVEGMT